jgi:predicted nucleotidyltransferase
MRLSEYEIQVIKDSVHSVFKDARFFLFGSRLDINKKGGDIDLIIKTGEKPNFISKAKVLSAIYAKLGERKIDLIFDYPDQDNHFLDLIKLDAVEL